MIREKLIIIKNKEGEKLFGIYTLSKERKKLPLVIMVHGFSKTKSERKYVELARELAKNNIASFRFDFSGCGDSEGTLEKMSIKKEVEELKTVYQRLIKEKKIDKKRIGIFAHSLGAVIALLFQQKYQKVKCFVLVAPAFNQQELIKKWYTKAQIRKWRKQGYLDTPKFRIGVEYLKEAKDYTDLLREITIPTLFLHGKKDEDISLKMTKEAFKKLKSKEKQIIIIPEGDHHFAGYSSQQNLIKLSLKWFKKFL